MDRTAERVSTTCQPVASLDDQGGLHPLRGDSLASVANEPSAQAVGHLPTRGTRVQLSQRQTEVAALEKALSLLGFNPKLLCHFLWGKKAASLRLALSSTYVDIDAERGYLWACRVDSTVSSPEDASMADLQLEAQPQRSGPTAKVIMVLLVALVALQCLDWYSTLTAGATQSESNPLLLGLAKRLSSPSRSPWSRRRVPR